MIDMGVFVRKRYIVLAKRKGVDEPWSEWTLVNNYKRAIYHQKNVEKMGHCAKVEFNDDGIEEMWGILGGDVDLADKIFDANFRKEDRVIRETYAKTIGILNKLIIANNNALSEAQELENTEDVAHYTSKKEAFLQLKEALSKVTEETEETEGE